MRKLTKRRKYLACVLVLLLILVTILHGSGSTYAQEQESEKSLQQEQSQDMTIAETMESLDETSEAMAEQQIQSAMENDDPDIIATDMPDLGQETGQEVEQEDNLSDSEPEVSSEEQYEADDIVTEDEIIESTEQTDELVEDESDSPEDTSIDPEDDSEDRALTASSTENDTEEEISLSDTTSTDYAKDETSPILRANAPLRANGKFTSEDGIVYQKIYNEDAVAVVGYEGDSGEMIIPGSVVNPDDGNTYPVTRISQDLVGYKKVVNLVVPDSVTYIANSAFTECTNLKSVKLGNGITSLDWTFNKCTSLTDVTLPESLEEMYGTFAGCSSLTSLTLPDGLQRLGIFQGSGIKEITIPDSVTEIYSNGFQNCKELETIHLNSTNLTSLKDRTFLGCENLKTITGGEGVRSIGNSCFGGYDYSAGAYVFDSQLTSLGGIDLSQVTSIGEYAFMGASQLSFDESTLNLDKIKSLGKYAFWNVLGIEKLSFGEGLGVIPAFAFEYCYYLTEVNVPNSVTLIGESAFGNADAPVITIGSDNSSRLVEIGADAFRDDTDGSKITIHTAQSDVKLKENSFGDLDEVIWTVESEEETGVIYINGQTGNDANDGGTKETAVKTFERAKQIAAENPEITTIYVTGTVPVSGEVSLAGTNAILKRDESFTGYLLRVAANNEATLKDLTIDGNLRKADAEKSLISVDNAILNIEEGTVLKNNKIISDTALFNATGGAICASNRSTVNMHDGEIQNNQACYGGGIYLDTSTLNMTGGVIQNNKAVSPNTSDLAAGGGIGTYVRSSGTVQQSVVNLSGGTIQNNSSEDLGGGISLGYGRASGGHNILNMTGGTIDGNSAGSSGGGIFVQAGYDEASGQHPSWSIANVSGGNITNNELTATGRGSSSFGGGGIYVNGFSSEYPEYHNGVLNLTNAVIADNSAQWEGGGYAGCPVSETHIYLKNGVAIFGNEGESASDIYILASNAFGTHSGNPEYTIAQAMLGGAPYHWKYDDGSEVPLNRLEGTLNAFYGQELRLHTDEVGDANTNALAKVWITGNTSATRGGGIGSNGTINMGEYETITLDVSKNWEDQEGDVQNRPEFITVELYRSSGDSSEQPVYIGKETIRPDENGDWMLTFTNLPKSDAYGTDYVYSVKEVALSDYTSTVNGNQEDGYIITNTIIEKRSISVTKVWVGEPANSVTVNLTADGVVIDTAELNEAGNWQHTFTDLPKFDNKDGHEIEYRIEEVEVTNYTSEITGDANSGFIITNTEEPTTTPEEPTTIPEEPTTTPEEPTTPQEEPTTPQEEPTTPQEESTTPQEEPTTPQEESTTPQEEPTTPQEESTTPQEEPTTPQEESTTIQEEPTTSEKPTTPTEKPTTPNSPKTGDRSNPLLYLLIMLVAGAELVFIGLLFRRIKHKK